MLRDESRSLSSRLVFDKSEDHFDKIEEEISILSNPTSSYNSKDVKYIESGSDAVVELRGSFAIKRYKKQSRFENEMRNLLHISRNPRVISFGHANVREQALTFPRYETDLMQALLEHPDLVCPQKCCGGILAALLHCHAGWLAHRDVKPENILIDENKRPVLCDLARSRVVYKPCRAPFDGTRAYAAPEALSGTCWLSNDVWSTAIVFYCVIERLFPFDESDDEASEGVHCPLVKRPRESDRAPSLEFTSSRWSETFGASVRSCVAYMLQPDFRLRPSLSQVRLSTEI